MHHYHTQYLICLFAHQTDEGAFVFITSIKGDVNADSIAMRN
jgi:hypothetical protein